MNCTNFEAHLVDYCDDNVSASDKQTIETHLHGCENCQRALLETQQLLQAFDITKALKPDASLRQQFQMALETEKQAQKTRVITMSKKKEFNYKLAFQIAASFVLLFTGYFFGTYTTKQDASEEIATLKEQTVALKEDMMLAMLDNRSASKRIQAVNYSESIAEPDAKITEALISRMQFDPNINVRLAAADALSRYAHLEEVKTAFINALSTETDPNLQITIIQFLVDIQEKRAITPMQHLLEQPETPEYVKAQASSGISQII